VAPVYYLIETNNSFIADNNDRHAHLTSLVHHFLTPLSVGGDIVFGEFDFFLIEKILGSCAIDAGRRGIYNDVFHTIKYTILCLCHKFLMAEFNRDDPFLELFLLITKDTFKKAVVGAVVYHVKPMFNDVETVIYFDKTFIYVSTIFFV